MLYLIFLHYIIQILLNHFNFFLRKSFEYLYFVMIFIYFLIFMIYFINFNEENLFLILHYLIILFKFIVYLFLIYSF
jgi:hypothetical protein